MEQAKPRVSRPEPAVACRFGGFALDPGRGTLRRPDGSEAGLRPKTAEVLRFLAGRAGQVVAREALMEAVWPGVVVGDDSITQCVAEIRRALGEAGAELLRTLPKRGYLLAVEAPAEAAAAPAGGDAPAPVDRPSLAVLPFANLGGDPEQEYLADGIADELTTALSRLRWFFVIARGSAFTYRGKVVDVRQVGRELGVRYVLEGSVRKAGGRVRITCELAEAETGHQVWSDRFEGDLADLFGLQDQVAEAVAGAIEPSLQGVEIARARCKPTASLDAYDLYLRALPHHYAATREGGEAALALLRRAMALDPGFALAKALAARCQGRRRGQGWADAADDQEGLRLAREAIAEGSDDPAALRLAGRALAVLGFEHGAALAAVERALALNPHSAEAHSTAGWINNWLCRPAPAIMHLERAIRLSPLDPEMAHHLAGLALAHLIAGRHEAALDFGLRALRERPDWADAHRQVITALFLLDRREEASAAARRYLQVKQGAARIFADRARRLFADPAFAELRIRALREAGLPE